MASTSDAPHRFYRHSDSFSITVRWMKRPGHVLVQHSSTDSRNDHLEIVSLVKRWKSCCLDNLRMFLIPQTNMSINKAAEFCRQGCESSHW